ncbi:helix-turn-helix transcriptional regulator [Phaeodactylibacter sp.]|uniref:helix-turn-helix domain-containing protein n=1 Tax=Phaeodactylibacter sp. TaxID=1940289 RepID=UPI0025EFA6FD|nr:helix-turn-helix transcriptional regulator [Phaeodactylibacter sp.]MCI4650816.1 helix-turn-helix domain-containing protein [Phaeodactylibacter sp.]MCI5089773.1 helix-turn-helix domain-containing protein [Phaeodactylibacter sp.]
MLIGKNIRYLRKREGHIQKWLAQQLSKSAASVSEYEKDISIPPIDVAQQICDIYGITLDDLVNKDLEAESYTSVQQDEANESQAAYKNDELLNKMLAVKVLELIEILKREAPEEYEKNHLHIFVDTIKETFGLK